MNSLIVEVIGEPAPQGSKKAYVVNGRAVLVESSSKLKPWRATIAAYAFAAAKESNWQKIDTPVRIEVDFFMPRPASVKRSVPDRKPDLDKLLRSVLDGLTDAQVWTDDSRVCEIVARKHYADKQPSGAIIRISELQLL